jgi:hypothetical protein
MCSRNHLVSRFAAAERLPEARAASKFGWRASPTRDPFAHGIVAAELKNAEGVADIVSHGLQAGFKAPGPSLRERAGAMEAVAGSDRGEVAYSRSEMLQLNVERMTCQIKTPMQNLRW